MTYLNSPLSKPRLRFCLRATINALLAFGLVHVLAVPLHGLWAVPTAVVVIQMSFGGSLKATAEYIIGTIAGAVYASAVAALVPHPTVLGLAAVLAVAVAPLTYAAAVSPSFRVAPVTAVLVLMISAQVGEAPIDLAFDRLLEVGIGAAVAITVSLLVFPARAHVLEVDEAAHVLERMAWVLPAVMSGFWTKADLSENLRRQNEIREAVHAFEEVAADAKPERFISLAAQSDPALLARTLLRLRHDLIMIGRAASAPLPDHLTARLGPILEEFAATARDCLLASANALTCRRTISSGALVDTALAAYISEVASIEAEGLMADLSVEGRERLFALGFALQQLPRHFSDLAHCLQEWARNPDRPARPSDSAVRFKGQSLSTRR
jgi:uncharacterized membrane protein YccC